MTFRDWLNSIINLFYPRVCAACGEALLKDEKTVCLKCRYLLPKTGYELNPDNPLAQTFYGRVRFHAVTAAFFFAKSGKVQHLIHELKYKGNKDAGIFLGQQLGETIKNAPLFQDIDYLIPVPLHPKRLRERGYNQSEYIARGISEITGIPIDTTHLTRTRNTPKQALQDGEGRKTNVAGAFAVNHPEQLYHQRILVVDDLITTGETMRSCLQAMRAFRGAQISVFALCKAR